MRKILIFSAWLFFLCVSLISPQLVGAAVMAPDLSGRILLQVEAAGEAWYVHPDTGRRIYLGRPVDAFELMRQHSLGVSESDFKEFDICVPERLAGRILLRVEADGQAYYVHPARRELFYLGRPADAFAVMREQGLGISNTDLARITIEPVLSKSRIYTPVRQFKDHGSPEAVVDDDASETGRLEKDVLARINQYRRQLDLPELIWNEQLAKIARRHSADMAAGNLPFSHNGFDERLKQAKEALPLSWMSENVAYSYGYDDPAEKALVGWLQSSSHHEAIVNDFDLSGVGAAVNEGGYYYFTQIFVRR